MRTTGQRRSIRLKSYDYATPGAYFVTICTAGREPILEAPRFQDVVNDAWSELPRIFPALELDELVIMPDHVHFVVSLQEARGSAAQSASGRAPTLADVVRAFKGNTARRMNRLRWTPGAPVWQRNYYERIVRDEDELARTREYIANNPLRQHCHSADDLADAWEPHP